MRIWKFMNDTFTVMAADGRQFTLDREQVRHLGLGAMLATLRGRLLTRPPKWYLDDLRVTVERRGLTVRPTRLWQVPVRSSLDRPASQQAFLAKTDAALGFAQVVAS